MTDDGPKVAVIIPAYRAWETLPSVLDALERQCSNGVDVVVVDSTGPESAERLAHWPWVTPVLLSQPTLPGRGRNLALETTDAELIAFIDADAVPDPTWLSSLRSALTDDVDAVAGSVLNGTPNSATGTAGWLLEFSEWLPGRHEPLRHAATCNLLVRRSALDDAGGFREDMWPGEDTVLTFEIATRGRLGYAPAATVRHVNRVGARNLVRHQRRLGAAFVGVCSTVDFPHRRLGRPARAPLATMLRILALWRRLRGHPAERRTALHVLPALALGLAGWSDGVLRPRPASPPR